jgi:WD40 repeat protein
LRAAQRAKARRRIATAAALAAVAVAVPAGIWAWQESVKREIALHDHIANLKSLGRSALEADEPGTAAAYLGEAYRLGETSLSLRYQLAKAMRGVDPLERVLRQVPAHGGPWTIARFSADGKRVITCSVSNNKIAIWDVASGGKVREIDTGAWVGLAGFSPDGNRVYSTTNDNVKLWDAATGAPLKTLSGLARPGAMLSPRFASDWSRIFIRNIDGSVHLYRAPEYDEAWKAGGPEAKVGTSIGMSPSGRFAVGAIGDRIHAWWLQQPPRDTSAAAPAEGVKQVLAAPDDASFAVLGNDGSVRLWDAATLRPSATYPGRAPVSLSSFSRDGRVLVMEGNDNQQEFWRVPLAAATSAPYAGATASFTPDGHWFAHGRLDTVRVVSAVTGKPRLTLAGHSAEVLDAVFDPAGERLLSFGRDGTARLWRMPAADDAPVIRVPHSGYVIVSDLLYSADGRRLIALMSDGRKLTADAATGEVIRSVQGPATDVRTAGLPVDENDRVIFVFSDNHYELWDMAAGRRVATLAARGMHSEATLDRHGRYAVSMTPVAAEVVDAAAGARLLSVPGFHAEGRPDDVIETWVQFTDDGGRVAIADGRNPVRIVALPRGEVVDTLPDWTAGTVTLSWGPGDQTLGLVDGQGLLSVWDLARKAVAHTLQSQNGQIWLMRAAGRAAEHATQGHLLWNLESGTSRFLGGVVWPGWKESGDGSRLATVGGDARLRLWDTAAGEVLDTFATGASWISDEAFTPDGRRLAVSDNLAVINQWPLGQPEARSAVEVQAVLRCKLPWKIDGDVALPVTEEPAGCP